MSSVRRVRTGCVLKEISELGLGEKKGILGGKDWSMEDRALGVGSGWSHVLHRQSRLT